MNWRIYPSVALAVLAFERGAKIIRCHDVRETKLALDMADSILTNHQPLGLYKNVELSV